MDPAIFFLPLRPGLKRLRSVFEAEGVKHFAHMDDVTLGLSGITASTARVVPFLRNELASIGFGSHPNTTMAFPPKGHIPTAEEIALLGSADVRIAKREGATVVGVLIGPGARG